MTDINGTEITVGATARHEADGPEHNGTVVQLFPMSDWVRLGFPNGAVEDVESWHLLVVL